MTKRLLLLSLLACAPAPASSPSGQVELPPPVPTGLAWRQISNDWVHGTVYALDDSTRRTTCYAFVNVGGISCVPWAAKP